MLEQVSIDFSLMASRYLTGSKLQPPYFNNGSLVLIASLRFSLLIADCLKTCEKFHLSIITFVPSGGLVIGGVPSPPLQNSSVFIFGFATCTILPFCNTGICTTSGCLGFPDASWVKVNNFVIIPIGLTCKQ